MTSKTTKLIALACALALSACCLALAGCSKPVSGAYTSEKPPAIANATMPQLEDGHYIVDFTTDNPSMFHANEVMDDHADLYVENGAATCHVVLAAKGIVNLYVGTKENAKTDEANILQPTTETIEYGDGTTDEAYAFDIPVPILDEEFDVAILGKKGKWYDHKVVIGNAQPAEE